MGFYSGFKGLIKFEFSGHILKKKPSNIKFHENPSSGRRVVPLRTYGPTDKHESLVAFRSFASVPNKGLTFYTVNTPHILSQRCTYVCDGTRLTPCGTQKCNAQVTTIVTALLRTGLRSSSQPDTEWWTKCRYTTSSVAWQRNWFSSVTPFLSKGPTQCLAQIVSLDLTQLTDVGVSLTPRDHLT